MATVLEQLDVVYPPGSVALPDAGRRLRIGAWAKSEAEKVLDAFGEGVHRSELKMLAKRLAGWGNVNVSWRVKPGQGTLVLDPDTLEELAYVALFIYSPDEVLRDETSIENGYDIQGTPLVGQRQFQRVEYPAGRGVRAFSLRDSSFGDVETVIRTMDDYVFAHDEPFVFVVTMQWAKPDWDTKAALHERGCSAGLNPPASSSDRAM